MNKKYIFSFVLFSFCLLLNVSYALPDFYVYENYLQGWTVYTIPSSADGYTEQWESYSFTNERYGVVCSFNNEIMGGSEPQTAVPLVNMDWYTGKVLTLQPGECVAVYSEGCSINHLDYSADILPLSLGTTSAVYSWEGLDVLNRSDSMATTFTKYNYDNLSDTEFYIDVADGVPLSYIPSTTTYSTPYACSQVFLLYNGGNNVGSYWVEGMESDTYVESPSIAFEQLEWFCMAISDSQPLLVTFMPYINGNIDVYSGHIATADLTSTYIYYNSNYRFNFINPVYDSSSDLLSVDLANWKTDSLQVQGRVKMAYYQNSYFVPIFIHSYNASRYVNPYAIYVYDGWVDISNYDELIQKLKDAGFGQSGSSVDLSRIEELLEEINSGGENGQAVKELIDIIEGLENQVFDNLDTTEIFSTWDTYKSLLDFSSLNWLIVANNRMFEIFCGVIVLSAIFIVFDRCLR